MQAEKSLTHVTEALENMGREMLDLSRRLHEDGDRPPTGREMQLIRFAALPTLEEMLTDVKMSVLTGDREFSERILGALTDFIRNLI